MTSCAITRVRRAFDRWNASSPRSAAKVVKALLLKQVKGQVSVTAENLNEYLGVRKFTYGRARSRTRSGRLWVGLDRGGW